MERSLDRVLVTHAGALAKPPELASLVRARGEGESYDPGALERPHGWHPRPSGTDSAIEKGY